VVDLSPFNTLRVPAKAERLITVTSPDQIPPLVKKGLFQKPFFILGHGANVLFTKDFSGPILLVQIPGRKIISEDDKEVVVEIAAGETWPEFVTWTVQNNYAGVENLALVPGSVGSGPYQNIAAYGQSLDEVFVSLRAINLATGKAEKFSKADCQFRYRESIFKHQLRNKYLITHLTLKLTKIASQVVSNYYSRHESVESELAKFATPPYTIQDIYQAVVNLRTVKLPDWKKIQTAGSFFKNPFVTKEKLNKLQTQISELQFYPTTGMDYPKPDDPVFDHTKYVKIPAGRLLDELGWRGKKIGHVGTFEKHALIIVAYPGATGPEIFEFAESMRSDVKKNFNIDLEYEVVIV
jgi:UDP-N-acetylmuramate dehydrogenase